MTLSAVLEEDRRNVFRECDILRQQFRVIGPARGQRKERDRRAENNDDNDNTRFFHMNPFRIFFARCGD